MTAVAQTWPTEERRTEAIEQAYAISKELAALLKQLPALARGSAGVVDRTHPAELLPWSHEMYRQLGDSQHEGPTVTIRGDSRAAWPVGRVVPRPSSSGT